MNTNPELRKIRFNIMSQGIEYRLFTIMYKKDKKGIPYIKIVIPDNQHITGQTVALNKFVPPDLFTQDKGKYLSKDEIHEMSYHYMGGVAHFKGKNGHLHQMNNLFNLRENDFFLLSRLNFTTISWLKPFNKKRGVSDVLLKFPFNDLGRLFNIYLTKVNVRIDNDRPKLLPLLAGYAYKLPDEDSYVIIQEFTFMKKELIPYGVEFSWFLPKNQDSLVISLYKKLWRIIRKFIQI